MQCLITFGDFVGRGSSSSKIDTIIAGTEFSCVTDFVVLFLTLPVSLSVLGFSLMAGDIILCMNAVVTRLSIYFMGLIIIASLTSVDMTYMFLISSLVLLGSWLGDVIGRNALSLVGFSWTKSMLEWLIWHDMPKGLFHLNENTSMNWLLNNSLCIILWVYEFLLLFLWRKGGDEANNMTS